MTHAVANFAWLHVLVVYGVAVALARRSRVDLPWRVAGLFYALVLVFLFRVLAQDNVSFCIDTLNTLPPWTYLTSDRKPLNGELNDLPLQIVPWAHQVRQSWTSLRLPLWNERAGCGYPLLANGQSSAFSIVRLLTLPLSLGHAMSAEAALKLLIALTFTFLYCRGRRYSEIASVAGAVSFGFCGFLVSWLHFPLVTVACFAPAVLYCIDRLAEGATYARFVFAVAVAVAMIYGGHPETVSHLFLLATGYVLWMCFVERPDGLDWKTLFRTLLGAAAVATLLSLPYLAPVAEAIPQSRRYRELKQAPLSPAVGYADWISAVLLVQPHFFGRAPLQKTWLPADTEPLSGYAGVLAIAAWVAVVANAVLRRQFRSREVFFALASLAAIGVIFNWPFFSHAIHAVLPIGAHARVRFIFALMVALQAAAAVDFARRTPLLIGITAAAVTLIALLTRIHFPSPDWRHVAVVTMTPSIAVLLFAVIAIVVRRPVAWLPVIAAMVVELFLAGRSRNPPVPNALTYPRTPLTRALDALKKQHPPNDPFRIAGVGAVLYPNAHAVYGYEDIRVHDPMSNQRYLDFMALAAGMDIDRYHQWWERDIETHTIDLLNVRYVATYTDTVIRDRARFREVYVGPDGSIFENRDALPRFFAVRNVILDFDRASFLRRLRENQEWGQTAFLDRLQVENQRMSDDFFHPRPADAPLAKVRIVDAGPTAYRVHVSAPRYSLVVSSVAWWPGWKVERDGKRIDPIRVNSAFLGFAVPPGESDVRVWYSPLPFQLGAAIALLTVGGLVFFGVRRRAPKSLE